MDSTFFTYDGKIYKQVNGCAMSSDILSTIAAINTNAIFDSIIPKLSFTPKIMLKYVDDILMY